MMKLIFVIFLFSIHFTFSQNSVDDLLKMFNENIESLNLIEEEVFYNRVIEGKIDSDSTKDVIIEFGIGFKGANSILYKKAFIYLNRNNVFIFQGEIQLNYCMNILEINNKEIIIEELETCLDPFPEVIRTRKYKYNAGVINEINE